MDYKNTLNLPYANGRIHIGHALNKVLKDIVLKYKHLAGYRTPYRPGWDCHGLPIELEVEKSLGAQGRRQADILDVRARCRDYADRFVDVQREEFGIRTEPPTSPTRHRRRASWLV